MENRSVYIVGSNSQYERMFVNNGWGISKDPLKSDLIQFTGGSDVTPDYYGASKHDKTYNNIDRDIKEASLFNTLSRIPMAGICRGGQFLNVMCGGSLYQHVDNHANGSNHMAMIVDGGQEVEVSSTHHQMIIPSGEAEVLLIASLSNIREIDNNISECFSGHEDVEACVYKEDGVLCFQPHPEYFASTHECQELYFQLIDEYLFNGEE